MYTIDVYVVKRREEKEKIRIYVMMDNDTSELTRLTNPDHPQYVQFVLSFASLATMIIFDNESIENGNWIMYLFV